ncbi:MAG: S8 family serine peptidase [Bacteroidota bacterium]
MNNIKILYLALLLIFTLPAAVQGQQLDHKLGEFIVQISEDYDERQAFKELKEIKNYGASLTVQRILVPDLRIYLLSVDFTKVNEIEMLRLLRQQKSIKLAQFNHLIEYRNTPNDPQFSSQWQYINDGSNGGTLNADFDADLAWDITTGGLSPNGDSIVICVIDEGFDTEHSDLQPNHWINHAEIPDNNIDDDGNGYVDDYEGWNSYTENDNMGLIKGHGTPVAGIVGAKGNNGIGVSGVNWDVELMLVVGGGEEALALAAYAYPYAARKRYNETAGKEGAFVVATNASWGIPSLREVDAPIWCAFYDSLGQEGILSMAATENRNIDVDAEGDLPANCSSEFLIAVTNMDRTGNKLNSAGFGATHIDLGAYGAQTFNITSSNGYGSFGGTSAATPHVAGTVGLLYAAPCPSFSSLALNDPRAAALLARQFLLDGVVPSPSLAGITVTGGGLNMYNSLQMLMDNCDPCPAPALFGASTVTDKEMILDWVETDSILSVDLQWRIQGSTEWSTVQDATMPYTLSNLSACTLYELQLRSFCNADTSDYSKLLVVETDGCCRPPSDLSISDRQAENVTANWSAVLAANSYNLRYRQTGTMDWSTQNTTAVNVLLSGLGSCSDYELQIQTVCDTGATAFSPSLLFESIRRLHPRRHFYNIPDLYRRRIPASRKTGKD